MYLHLVPWGINGKGILETDVYTYILFNSGFSFGQNKEFAQIDVVWGGYLRRLLSMEAEHFEVFAETIIVI